jgi:hypothetical protein
VALAAVQPFLDGAGSPITIDDDPERTKQSDADAGAWLGTQPLVVTQQWQRCADLTPTSCEDITGETAPSYTPTAVDVNADGLPYHLRMVVTATNVAGVSSAAGPISANPVLPGTAPTNTSVPSISGAFVIGATLTADAGSWAGTGSVLYTYQWRRCDAVGADCHDVLGATGESYVSAPEDDGLTLVVEVTGHNLVGVSAPTSSAVVGPITP